jgi:proteasome lid subunit RPN8/RPN11
MQTGNSRPLPAEEAPTLLFAPLAWLKLQWFCHAGDTEIGGFGISSERNLLHVEDFITVRQSVTAVSVHFEDAAVADFFDACVDRGIRPERCVRIWIHTHPGASPQPSRTDEETFRSKFGQCDWAVMFIVGRTGLTYARLAFSAGPGGQLLLPVGVRWSDLPKGLATAEKLDLKVSDWQQEYAANIQPGVQPAAAPRSEDQASPESHPWWEVLPWSDQLDAVYYEPLRKVDLHDPFLR